MIISAEEPLFLQILLLQPNTFKRVSVQMNWTVCTDGSDRIKKVRVDLRKLALGLTACSNGLQSKENVEVVVVVDS